MRWRRKPNLVQPGTRVDGGGGGDGGGGVDIVGVDVVQNLTAQR